jgi:hypothetical protein
MAPVNVIRLGLGMLIKVPTTPDCLLTNGEPIAIQEFDDEELRRVGNAWTLLLIAKAELRRKREGAA